MTAGATWTLVGLGVEQASLMVGAMIGMPLAGAVVVGMLVVFGVVVWSLGRRHRQQIEALKASHRESLAVQDSGHREHVYRLQREQDQALERASFGLVRDLLPAFDALHQAIESARQQATKDEAHSVEFEAVVDGLLMVEKSLLSALERHGISQVEAQPGASYDPHVHEAIGVIPTDAVPSGAVAVLLRHGWQHPAGLLRPAMVQTATAPPPPAPAPELPESLSGGDAPPDEEGASSDAMEALSLADLAEEP